MPYETATAFEIPLFLSRSYTLSPRRDRAWLPHRLQRLRFEAPSGLEQGASLVHQLRFDALPARALHAITVLDGVRVVFHLASIVDGSHELRAGEMLNAIWSTGRWSVPVLDLQTEARPVSLASLAVQLDLQDADGASPTMLLPAGLGVRARLA